MNSDRTVAIEDAFRALEGVSSAKLYRQGIVEGIDLAVHPAIEVRLAEPDRAVLVFLAHKMLAFAPPDDIATHYSSAVQHYQNDRRVF